jgi:hypothetical protein
MPSISAMDFSSSGLKSHMLGFWSTNGARKQRSKRSKLCKPILLKIKALKTLASRQLAILSLLQPKMKMS